MPVPLGTARTTTGPILILRLPRDMNLTVSVGDNVAFTIESLPVSLGEAESVTTAAHPIKEHRTHSNPSPISILRSQ